MGVPCEPLVAELAWTPPCRNKLSLHQPVTIFLVGSTVGVLLNSQVKGSAHSSHLLSHSSESLVVELSCLLVGRLHGRSCGYTGVENPLGGTYRTVDALRATPATCKIDIAWFILSYLSKQEDPQSTAEADKGPSTA